MTPGELTGLALFTAFTWGALFGAYLRHRHAARSRSLPPLLYGTDRSDDR